MSTRGTSWVTRANGSAVQGPDEGHRESPWENARSGNVRGRIEAREEIVAEPDARQAMKLSKRNVTNSEERQ
jgi:hypothetical protein